jgi:hypothetical protein
MTISLVCASAGAPGSAKMPAIAAADSKDLFIDSSLGRSLFEAKIDRKFSPFFRSCGP